MIGLVIIQKVDGVGSDRKITEGEEIDQRVKPVPQLSWLERYTDNVEVGSSSLPETTFYVVLPHLFI